MARATVTLGVLGLLLAWLPRDQLWAALRRVDAPLWVTVLVGFVAGHGVAALKWRLLLNAAGVPAGATEALRAHGAGLFANLCLPSLVGGDVVRAAWIGRRHGRPEALAVSLAADRLIDTASLLALAALGGALAPGQVDGLAGQVLTTASAVLLAAAIGIPLALARIPAERLPGRVGRVAAQAREAMRGVVGRPRAALAALGLSLAIQGFFVLLNARLGAAVGIELPFAIWLLTQPLAKLFALVPVSLGGIGIREGMLAALLVPFGVEPALAVAQSLLWETVLVAGGMSAGAGALWLRRADAPAASDAARSTP